MWSKNSSPQNTSTTTGLAALQILGGVVVWWFNSPGTTKSTKGLRVSRPL
jgi:hypothetical protein